MKILHVITRSEIGGAQAVVLAYMRALSSYGSLALATGREGFLATEARGLGIPVFILPELVQPIAPLQDCRAVGGLCRIIRACRPDLVHAHSSKAGLIGRLSAKLSNVPSVFTAHGFAFTENAGLLRRMVAMPSEWMAAKLGQAVIAVSDYDRDLAVRCRVLARNQVSVIHNGLADVPFRATPAEGSPVNLVMVARFAPPKEHTMVLRALRNAPSTFKLWLIGEGPNFARTRAEALQLGLEDRITFMGARNDVPEILSKAHIFVLASSYEGLPISILEAMRAALPVVSSDVGGVHECVRHGVTGYLVGRGDVETLGMRLRELIVSPRLRETMGRAGRQVFQSKFTQAAMIDKTLDIYEAVLEGAATRANRGIRQAPVATSFGERTPLKSKLL